MAWNAVPLEKEMVMYLLFLPASILKDQSHAGMIGQNQFFIFKQILCRKLQCLCELLFSRDVRTLPFCQNQICKAEQAAL